MQLHFTGRNVEITPALKTFTEEKFQRLQRRFNGITTVNIILQIEHTEHLAEATLHLTGAEINATGKATDMYAAIDDLIDKLAVQITKHKEKISDHHR